MNRTGRLPVTDAAPACAVYLELPMQANEWIDHTGTTCPVDPAVPVLIAGPDGVPAAASMAGNLDWSDAIDPEGRIAMYRVLHPDAALMQGLRI